MRKNEFKSIEEFTSMYTGEWAPSDGHWFGLDFVFDGIEYRFNTGSMYDNENTILPNGRIAMFGIYRKNDNPKAEKRYDLLEEFSEMDDVLKSTCISGIVFKNIIMDDNTVILGQD